MLKSWIARQRARWRHLERKADRQLMLTAAVIAEANRARVRLGGLQAVEFCAYSQWGEDGILDWLIERLAPVPRSFIEFGTDDYRESNTRFLLQKRNWRGMVIDSSAANVEFIRGDELFWRYDLQATCAFVTKDNINRLITDARLGREVGVMSIDVDGNDYWIWKAIDVVSPVIVVCEYNAVLGDLHELTVPYAAEFQRKSAHSSTLYFGASVKALIMLAEEKGYDFVGTNSAGCNAFFVRKDVSAHVVEALDARYMFPSRFRESRDEQGHSTHLNGPDRVEAIGVMPLVDVRLSQLTCLRNLKLVTSAAWAAAEPTQFARLRAGYTE